MVPVRALPVEEADQAVLLAGIGAVGGQDDAEAGELQARRRDGQGGEDRAHGQGHNIPSHRSLPGRTHGWNIVPRQCANEGVEPDSR